MSQAVRVLHCSSGNLYGGVETLLATLAREAPADSRPEFALCFEGRSSEELRASGAEVHLLAPVRFSRPWTVWQARRKLGQLLAARPYDVVVCHGGWPHWICGPVVRRTQGCLVFWLHDFARGTHWVERLAAKTTPDLALAGSQCAVASIPKIFPRVDSEVFYPPVVAPTLDRKTARSSIRTELGTADETTVIVVASRLDPLKGHQVLIEALGTLKSCLDWELWIAGSAQRTLELQYLHELKGLTESLDVAQRIRFLGHRSDIPNLMAAADIYCQPNLRPESFGLAFVEAMDASLPVVTSSIGAAEEIVDEACGILVPPGDPKVLAESLRVLIDEPERRRRLGSAGPARARGLCDPETAFVRLENLFRNAMRSGQNSTRKSMDIATGVR